MSTGYFLEVKYAVNFPYTQCVKMNDMKNLDGIKILDFMDDNNSYNARPLYVGLILFESGTHFTVSCNGFFSCMLNENGFVYAEPETKSEPLKTNGK